MLPKKEKQRKKKHFHIIVTLCTRSFWKTWVKIKSPDHNYLNNTIPYTHFYKYILWYDWLVQCLK